MYIRRSIYVLCLGESLIFFKKHKYMQWYFMVIDKIESTVIYRAPPVKHKKKPPENIF